MGENDGSDESEFGSVTSSQISFLNNCPFADLTKSLGGDEATDSHSTEVLGTPISPPVTRTPILSPSSLDSINDEDVFRTPPENASLSSAAESEPRARVSETASKLKSPSLQLLSAETVRVLEMNRLPDPKEPVTEEVRPLASPSSLAASSARVPGKHYGFDYPSPGKQSDLDSSPQSETEGIEVTTESGDDYEIEIPFKGVMEALLRNNGENLGERVSYVDILKQSGLNFP